MGAFGAGGEPGEPGPGGKVAIYTLTPAPGASYQVVIGKGGGGATGASAAAEGGATRFGAYSSAEGAVLPAYQDPMGGGVYASTGDRGLKGGDGGGVGDGRPLEIGGAGPDVVYLGVAYRAGGRGADYPAAATYRAYGGWGGGAAAGASAGPGKDAYPFGASGDPAAGAGGVGATPVKARAGVQYGQGGQGGHGGGGGGGGGANSRPTGTRFGDGGAGGAGGPGGDGMSGAVIVYMHMEG